VYTIIVANPVSVGKIGVYLASIVIDTINREIAQLVMGGHLANNFRYTGTADRANTAVRADRRSTGEGRSE
jgi:hypothetical protein